MDERLKLLSHSSRALLHSCPRKYQLYRLTNPIRESTEHTDFGSTLGVGIQSFMVHGSKEQAIWEMFCTFTGDIYEDGAKSKKTFIHAIFALDMFSTIKDTILREYEVATFKDKPAIEVGFKVRVGDSGFIYRGYVDIILQHKVTKQLLILELKTSKSESNEATYGNSGQGLGYSICAKEISPETDHFNVLYLVFETIASRYVHYLFTKYHTERALWIQDLIADCQTINIYDQYEVWPRYGESCFAWYKPCTYFGMCHMSNKALVPVQTQKEKDKAAAKEEDYEFELHLADLLQTQLTEVEGT